MYLFTLLILSEFYLENVQKLGEKVKKKRKSKFHVLFCSFALQVNLSCKKDNFSSCFPLHSQKKGTTVVIPFQKVFVHYLPLNVHVSTLKVHFSTYNAYIFFFLWVMDSG